MDQAFVPHFLRVALLLAAIAVAGCSSRVDTPQVGVPGGDTPSGFEVAPEQQRYVLYLTNDTERTRVSNVKLAEGELTAVFPGYEKSLRATLHRDRIAGSVTPIKAGGKEQVTPFKAKLGETYRFYRDAATANADVDGTWAATCTDDSGKPTRAMLLLKQRHDHLTGTVMTPTGDHRFLEGQVHGDELQLSTFAGGLAGRRARSAITART